MSEVGEVEDIDKDMRRKGKSDRKIIFSLTFLDHTQRGELNTVRGEEQ